MLKILAVYLMWKLKIPIHYTSWKKVEQAHLPRGGAGPEAVIDPPGY